MLASYDQLELQLYHNFMHKSHHDGPIYSFPTFSFPISSRFKLYDDRGSRLPTTIQAHYHTTTALPASLHAIPTIPRSASHGHHRTEDAIIFLRVIFSLYHASTIQPEKLRLVSPSKVNDGEPLFSPWLAPPDAMIDGPVAPPSALNFLRLGLLGPRWKVRLKNPRQLGSRRRRYR
jgi:hypothetical protein